jgi:hypothetical protein
MKIIYDILKSYGKWSFKRITAIYVLNIAIIYAFIPLIFPQFNVLEFVFWGFITYSGTMVGMILKQKMDENKSTNKIEEDA